MKNQILTIAAIALSVIGFTANKANAQATGTTELTVNLADVRVITVAQPTVAISLSTAADYTNGKSSTQNNHISVTSTGGYVVKVKADNANMTDGTNNIPVSTIAITPTVASGTAPTLSNVSGLTTSDQTIATGAAGTLATVFNVQYTASGGANYLNKPAGAYSVDIQYTIEPN